MVKCGVCGEEQEPSNFCLSCGSALNLDYPDATQEFLKADNPKHTRLWERLCLFLFREDVREDICENNYNQEAGLIFVAIILFGLASYGFEIFSNPSDLAIPSMQTGFPPFILIIISPLIQIVMAVVSTYIIGLIFRANITVAKIFRIYTYTLIPTLIITLIYLVVIGAFVPNLTSIDPFAAVYAALITSIPLAFGYKTLFKTNYLVAFIISLFVTTIASSNFFGF